MNESILSLTAKLLREPTELATRPAAALIPRLLAIAAVSAALFGLVIGSYRGGVQYVYAAIKMPMLFALPLLVGLPAVWSLHNAVGGNARYDRVVVAALLGMARAALLAAAAGPVLWLVYSVSIDYHRAILLMTGTLLLVGGIGMITMLRALPPVSGARWLAHLVSLGVLGAVLAQSGWLLRPFIARPRADVAFLRAVEADVFSSLVASSRAAAGDHQQWEADPSGLLGDRSAKSGGAP